MSETENIAKIASKVSKDIFKHFMWETHPLKDINFACTNKEHTDGKKGQSKKTHPGDVVFSYHDPYLGKNIYLHTDLKSYKKDSITSTSLRNAFKSLCMTIDCAKNSREWRTKYSIDDSEAHEVRGLLFVHNHDNEYDKPFYDAIDRINLPNLPLSPYVQLHFLGPHDIQNLYNIANDLIRLKSEKELPDQYTFYYPDLVLARRQGDVWTQAATIEVLTSPYMIIKHDKAENCSSGYLIYYNASAERVEEFEYFLDSLSRYQMLESEEKIRIRITQQNTTDDLKSIFALAKKKYVKAWGFDSTREKILNQIDIERITSVTSNYNPGDMGWRE